MKIYVAIISICTVCNILFACNNSSKKDAKIEVIKEISPNRGKHTLFDELLLSSDFPFPNDINKDDIYASFDNETNNIYTYRVYIETEGTGTIGWVKYDLNCNVLYDISGDIGVLSRILSFNQDKSTLYKISLKKEDIVCAEEKKTLLPFDFLQWLDWQTMKDMSMQVSDENRYYYYPINNNFRLNYYYSSADEYQAYNYFRLDCGETYDCYLVEIGYKGISTQYKLITLTNKKIVSELLIGYIQEEKRLVFNIDQNLNINLIEEKIEYSLEKGQNIVLSNKHISSYKIQADGQIISIDSKI